MTDEHRAELKRLALAYMRSNGRRAAEGLKPALVGVEPEAVLDLLAEAEKLKDALKDISTRCETKGLRSTYAPDDANLAGKAMRVLDEVWAAAREAAK